MSVFKIIAAIPGLAYWGLPIKTTKSFVTVRHQYRVTVVIAAAWISYLQGSRAWIQREPNPNFAVDSRDDHGKSVFVGGYGS